MKSPAIYEWKSTDTGPPVTAFLRDGYGNPVPLPAQVRFVMKLPGGGSPKVNGLAQIVDEATMEVQYVPTAADTDTAGEYWQEWVCTYPDGTRITVPNPGYDIVRILPKL